MNAPNYPPSDKRAAERKAYEPSMEEILASIRRIIADDQAFAPRQSSAGRSTGAPGAFDPLPPLGHGMPKERTPLIPPSPLVPPSFSGYPVDGQFQFFKAAVAPTATEAFESRGYNSATPEAAGADPDLYTTESGEYEVADPELPLVSAQTDAAVSSAFNALMASQRLPNGESLDQVIRDMLRPMLKAWLDDNLPVLVERLVRAEIERVARGGR